MCAWVLTLSPCEERRWEAGWRGVREAPQPRQPEPQCGGCPRRNAEVSSRNAEDGRPLSPISASVPEIPPSGYERGALFCKCVCVCVSRRLS